jgi:hypothetical protein
VAAREGVLRIIHGRLAWAERAVCRAQTKGHDAPDQGGREVMDRCGADDAGVVVPAGDQPDPGSDHGGGAGQDGG